VGLQIAGLIVLITCSNILRSLLILLFLACNREQNIGNATRGKEAIERYGCNACHNIPGVPGPKGMVGPPLDHMAARSFIAGKFPNNPQTMIKWLQNPPAYDSQTAMPNLGISADDSRDITAYLYNLK
jgi:cytochrome c2